MRICTNCGKKIPENTMFCPICGAKNDKFLPYESIPYTEPGPFSFSGRARRSEYWQMAIPVFLYSLVFLVLFLNEFLTVYSMVLSDGGENVDLFQNVNVGPFFILLFLGIPLWFWALAVAVRRLHDLGYSGWVVLLPGALSSIPYVGQVAESVFMAVLGCMDGEPGPNLFGPDPKGRGLSCLVTEEKVQGILAKLIASMVPIPGRNFMMGRTEVTQAQWEVVMGKNPSKNKDPDLPVENVSWYDCQAFIKKLNAKTGKKFRLPTEEEWEHACRAGETGDWGKRANGEEGPLDAMGWYADNSDGHTHPVGQKEPNAFGLYDMHGNVWEWTDTADGTARVLRGGGCWSRAGLCKASYRLWDRPVLRDGDIGFRLVLSQD